MKLTVQKDPETIKRYAHLGRAPIWGGRCGHRCPGEAHACAREKGHRGPHAAHSFFGRVVAAWDEEGRERLSRRKTRRSVRASRGGAFEEGRIVAALKAVGRRVAPSSVEELFLLVLFLAFVGFAVDWVLMILF